MPEGELIYVTKSVCPACLGEVYADITAREEGIYMEKSCPEHGRFAIRIWADSRDNYLGWLRRGGVDTGALPRTREAADRALAGPGFACGACQPPATAALMTTNHCNMDCPVCFTRGKGEPLHQPGLEECRRLLEGYWNRAGGDALLEFCGGEPTVRGDILELAAMARDIGFGYIQLNTNGVKLAESPGFCKALKDSGVTTAYLGFDGVTEKPYLAKYGRPMLDTKVKAVGNCAEAGLAVVLVACVIPGENDGELGGIVEFAKANMPAVKGVYLQPISYFGIYPEEGRRITIPEVIRKLAEQHPDISEPDFNPGSYDHPQCSFNAAYMLDRAGKLRPLGRAGGGPDGVARVRRHMRSAWTPGPAKTLTIGGMAFQDGSNIDLMRLKRCSIQIIQRDGRLIPLCGKYLTGCGGAKLFPGIG